MRRWRADIADVVLQVTVRAAEPARVRASAAASSPASSSSLSTGDKGKGRDSAASPVKAPDAGVLGLSSSWAESNLRAGSPLSALMKRRIRECVEEAVLGIVLPPPAPAPPPAPSATDSATEATATAKRGAAPVQTTTTTTNGLEPLMPEIRHLAERAAKLVQIHTNVYGGLYAHPSFLGLGGDGDGAASEGDAAATAAALVSAAAAVSAPA